MTELKGGICGHNDPAVLANVLTLDEMLRCVHISGEDRRVAELR